MVRLYWVLIVVLIVCLGPFIVYVITKRDLQGGIGIGGIVLGILTLLWMAKQNYVWIEIWKCHPSVGAPKDETRRWRPESLLDV